MQQSNVYVLTFTAIMTVIIGGLLSFTSQVLGPAQKKSIELDTKQQILGAVMSLEKGDDVLGIYAKRIKSQVVDINGESITTDKKGRELLAENVNILKNFKTDKAEREYPVYSYMNEEDSSKVEAYILPVYGNGLWNNIYGFIALGEDLNSIIGASFGHVQETPGLGARISDKDVQERFKGKKIFDNGGNLVSVEMLKGEKGDPSLFNDHQVDGMSGATLTAKGLNQMIKSYMACYQGFINKTKNQ